MSGRAPVHFCRYSQEFLDRVAEEVWVRAVVREVIALAEQASPLTDPQVRARLAALAGAARAGCREAGLCR